jgi:mannose-1-phosphate guanylyltransferase
MGLRAFVLAAGLGTRLRPLTDRWPKPAVPFLGAPLLRRTFTVLQRAGVNRVALNTHHLAERMAEVAREEGARVGLAVTVVHEPVIQGTAGGLRGLQAALPGADPVIAWNGDILFAPDLPSLVEGHRRSGAAATMVLLPMPKGRTYGTVEADAGGSVRRISGVGLATPGLTPWHFSGVHVLSPAVFEAMAASGPEDINREVYPRFFASGQVRGQVVDAAWSDLGTPGTYLDAQADVLAGRVDDLLLGSVGGTSRRAPGPFLGVGARIHPSAALGADTFVDAGVDVPAGASVQRSALLAGATVAPGEQVRGEIRWEGGGRLTERP